LVLKPEDEEIADAPGSSDLFFITMPLVLKPEDEEIADPPGSDRLLFVTVPLVLAIWFYCWLVFIRVDADDAVFEDVGDVPEDADDGLAGQDDVPVEEAPVAWKAYVRPRKSIWLAYDDSWAREHDEHFTFLPGVWNGYDALGEEDVVEEVIAAPAAVRNIDQDDYLSAEDVDEEVAVQDDVPAEAPVATVTIVATLRRSKRVAAQRALGLEVAPEVPPEVAPNAYATRGGSRRSARLAANPRVNYKV
jgi:hypothetical protein